MCVLFSSFFNRTSESRKCVCHEIHPGYLLSHALASRLASDSTKLPLRKWLIVTRSHTKRTCAPKLHTKVRITCKRAAIRKCPRHVEPGAHKYVRVLQRAFNCDCWCNKLKTLYVFLIRLTRWGRSYCANSAERGSGASSAQALGEAENVWGHTCDLWLRLLGLHWSRAKPPQTPQLISSPRHTAVLSASWPLQSKVRRAACLYSVQPLSWFLW